MTNFYPSITVGWDASIRSSNDKQESVYPNVPIIEKSSPNTLIVNLKQLWTYFLYNSTLSFPHFPIFAWNEVGEDSVLLPRVNEDGSIDFSYLEMVAKFIEFLKNFQAL